MSDRCTSADGLVLRLRPFYDFSANEKKKRWLSQSCSYRESRRIPDSIILVPVEVGLILRLDKCSWQLSLDQDGSCLPALLKGSKHRIIQRLL